MFYQNISISQNLVNTIWLNIDLVNIHVKNKEDRVCSFDVYKRFYTFK